MTYLLIPAGAALLTGAAFGVARWTYNIAFSTPKHRTENFYDIPNSEQYAAKKDDMIQMIRTLDQTPYEDVWITSHDGLRLHGKYYHVRDGAPVAIGFHGYRGTSIRDFCGGSKIAFEEGQNMLLIDQRAQGKSEGRTITFGIKERFDCLSWINYVIERFGADTQILLYGVSMGGATVLMASGLDLPPQVKGIVADCPYSSPKDIIRKVAKDFHYPVRIAYPFVKLGARIYGQFRLEDMTAEEAVKDAKVPILIIHGDDDRFVPMEMSRVVAEANPKCVSYQTFAGAGHGLSYIVDYDRYSALIRSFMKQVLD